ncbi:hypothetical protein B0T10DRAFT_553427 [Thelonectria olida]|uniref:Zn(2)-C6 fungal-type domain-containing protein n=1 Tax=Thelonectria olida TaxID=1576542 RepID=A0A9P8VTB2_9HYPO|nr:hypothetical protein B0T10DRAFT_553427 [Thelonectria olida]
MDQAPRKRRRLNYEKCHQCRAAKKKCEPTDRVWPQKCDRCIEERLECSENQRAAGSKCLPPSPSGEVASTESNSGVRLPIIAMTAYALKGDMERWLEKGVDDYIAKPVNRQLLMKKLLKWLVRPSDAVLATSSSHETINPLNAVPLHSRSATNRQGT